MKSPYLMDKRFKNNGFSMIKPVSVDRPIENCGLSIGLQHLVEISDYGALRGGIGRILNELSTIQSIEKQDFC